MHIVHTTAFTASDLYIRFGNLEIKHDSGDSPMLGLGTVVTNNGEAIADVVKVSLEITPEHLVMIQVKTLREEA